MCIIVLGRENYLIFICMLKPRLCEVLAHRPYSVGHHMTAHQSSQQSFVFAIANEGV